MVSDNMKDIEYVAERVEKIDDLYYEVFRLLQKELEDAVDEHPDAVPTERVLDILTATDMFYRKNYGTKEGTDRAGEGEL